VSAPPFAPSGAQRTRSARAARSWPELLAAAAGAGWFFLLGGARALPPTRLDWLGGGDWTQHALGWLFFRASRWRLPLGRIEGFPWPAGTTVGFTDANPFVAIPAKLVAPVLPLEFQYIGAWLLACFALQGYFGARLVRVASPRPAHRVLGGALLAIAPPLTARTGHDTLCAHFTLLAIIALHLAPAYDRAAGGRALRAAAVVTVLAGAVHPYLAVMSLALTAALAVRLAACDGALPRGRAGAAVLAATLALLAVFGVLGYLTSAPSHGAHFGTFGADLLAFANPFGASWLVPARASAWGAWEGNAYLGCGGALLVLAGAVLAVARRARGEAPQRPRRAAVPLLVAAGVLALFALSDVVRADGREVVSLRALYRPLAGIVGPFRSSGRFVWPLYYAVVASALVAVVRGARRPGAATALLAVALALQVAELAPGAAGAQFHDAAWRFRDARWELARGRYRHLALAPALVLSGGPDCTGPGWDRDTAWQAPAYEAYRLGLTVNSGYVARGAHDRFAPPCRAVEREVEEGRLAADTVYLVQPARAEELGRRPGVRCGVLDARHVCVAAAPDDPFAAALAGAVAGP
jgi:uncharacterized protein DUF6311